MRRSIKFLIPGLVVLGIALALFFIQDRYRSEKLEGTQEIPADQKAYYGTYGIREPEKRLEALKKFIVDFPQSGRVQSAYGEIFKLTIEIWPDDREKMLAASAAADTLQDVLERSYGYQFIAKELFAAKIFLDDAETFASKSISLLEKDPFIENEKQDYLEDEERVPSDAELNEKYLKELAEYRTTLGRICLEQGRVSEGEKILKEAYAVDPTIAQAAIGLAEIAEKRGDIGAALDYLTTAALTAGYAMEDARTRIEALYRDMHEGSLDGLEEILDAEYKRIFPNPVKIDRYRPAEGRSGRVVLAEFFTGAG